MTFPEIFDRETFVKKRILCPEQSSSDEIQNHRIIEIIKNFNIHCGAGKQILDFCMDITNFQLDEHGFTLIKKMFRERGYRIKITYNKIIIW